MVQGLAWLFVVCWCWCCRLDLAYALVVVLIVNCYWLARVGVWFNFNMLCCVLLFALMLVCLIVVWLLLLAGVCWLGWRYVLVFGCVGLVWCFVLFW